MRNIKTFLKKYSFTIVLVLSLIHILTTLYIFKGTNITNYPYIHQDFWKRMQDALYYTNGETSPAFHPPVPSILYALIILVFNSTNFVYVHILMYIFTLTSLFYLTKKLTNNLAIVFFAVTLFAFNFYILKQANFLGLVDLFAAGFINFAVFFFLEYLETSKKKFNYITGLFIGIGALVQYSGTFIGPILLFYAYKVKGKDWFFKNRFEIYKLSLISVFIFLSFFVLKGIFYGDPLYTRVEHLWFLRPHAEDIGYYMFNFFVFFSPIPSIVAIYTFYKEYKKKNYELLNKLLIFAPFIFFFMFLYIWEDLRFFTYVLAPVYILAGIGFFRMYKYFRVKNRIIVFFLLFFTLILYTNLHNRSSEGIPLLIGYSIKLENSIDSGKLYQRIIFNKETGSYLPYALYLKDYKKISQKRIDLYHEYFGEEYKKPEISKAVDGELSYYLETVNPMDVKEVVDFIGKENYREVAIDLENQKFVRFNQFDVFFERKTSYDFDIYDDIDLTTYRWYTYIITDHEISLESHAQVFANNVFRVYKNIEN